MSVSVGDRVITDHFMSDSALYGHCTEAQGSGKSCIIHATHSKTLTSISGYVPQYEDDGKELVCRSSIQEVGDRLPVKSVKANIVVNCKYDSVKGSLTVRGVGMFMSLFERNYKV